MSIERSYIDFSLYEGKRGSQDDTRSMWKLLREIKTHIERVEFVKEDEFSYKNIKFAVAVGHPSAKGHPSR